MKKRVIPKKTRSVAVELFEAQPNALYGLDAAAELAGVSRRALLVYCRAGLVHPVFESESGVMAFTEEAIQATRQIERLRALRSDDLTWVKMLFELLDEVEALRAEVRFLRSR